MEKEKDLALRRENPHHYFSSYGDQVEKSPSHAIAAAPWPSRRSLSSTPAVSPRARSTPTTCRPCPPRARRTRPCVTVSRPTTRSCPTGRPGSRSSRFPRCHPKPGGLTGPEAERRLPGDDQGRRLPLPAVRQRAEHPLRLRDRSTVVVFDVLNLFHNGVAMGMTSAVLGAAIGGTAGALAAPGGPPGHLSGRRLHHVAGRAKDGQDGGQLPGLDHRR